MYIGTDVVVEVFCNCELRVEWRNNRAFQKAHIIIIIIMLLKVVDPKFPSNDEMISSTSLAVGTSLTVIVNLIQIV